jgi:signal transduction histidine kinase
LRKFGLSKADRAVLKSQEFEFANRNEGFDLLRLGAMLMGIFALLAFITVATAQNHGSFASNWNDTRQLARIGMFALVVIFILWSIKYENFAAEKYRTVSTIVWFLLNLGLTILVLAHFNLALRAGTPEAPHGRYGAAVLMVTLVIYMLGSLGATMVLVLIAPATIAILTYNYMFLSSVDSISFAIYFLIAHIIGITFNQYKFKRDVELFLKNRHLDAALFSLKTSEAREKEISAAKTRLIASVSHDLRQPLNSLALYNNLLKSKFGGQQNSGLNSIAERVQECVAAMEGNLTRLQDIAQLQARANLVELRPSSLADTLRSIKTVFQPIADHAKVRLLVRADHPVDIILHSHQERLFEILANLLSNAIKFSSFADQRKPWVLVRARTKISSEGLSSVEIMVKDNGLGIAPEHHEHIFDEYIQLNNPERQSAKGYGLGLSVVRELTNSLPGHSLKLHSRLGQGANFILTTPRLNEVQTKGTEASQYCPTSMYTSRLAIASLADNATGSIANANIVLIEDDHSLRAALTAQLQELGGEVRAYPSAKHALAATANDIVPPTCIISDYWLPEPFDGLQTIARLRENFGESVPALLISAASDIDPLRIEKVPHLEFALKPVSATTLCNFIGKHIDSIQSK